MKQLFTLHSTCHPNLPTHSVLPLLCLVAPSLPISVTALPPSHLFHHLTHHLRFSLTVSEITIFSASYEERNDDDPVLSTRYELSSDELCLTESSSREERCLSSSVSVSSSAAFTSSPADLPASSSLSSSVTSLPCLWSPSLVTVAIQSAPLPAVNLFGDCLTHPPLASRRAVFLICCSPRFLRVTFCTQLIFHLAFLAASIYLLCSHSQLLALLDGRSQSNSFRVMLELPTWLMTRSTVSVVLSIRRLVLMREWRTSCWDAVWCGVVMWLSSAVFACSAMVALGDLPNVRNTPFVVMWVVVAGLLLLTGAHICLYGIFCMFFPLSVTTINIPIVPLDIYYYSDPPSSQALAKRGLTQQQLDHLPTVILTVKRGDPVCAICMDDMEVGEVQRELRCGHGYHQQCIDPWLMKKGSCPLCVRAVRVVDRLSSKDGVIEMAEKRGQSHSL